MISIKAQKILAFIPFLNCSILFIAFFVNSKHMKDGWLWVLIKHIFLGFIVSLPFVLLLWHLEDLLMQNLNLINFYIFSVINTISLVYAQTKLLNK